MNTEEQRSSTFHLSVTRLAYSKQDRAAMEARGPQKTAVGPRLLNC